MSGESPESSRPIVRLGVAFEDNGVSCCLAENGKVVHVEHDPNVTYSSDALVACLRRLLRRRDISPDQVAAVGVAVPHLRTIFERGDDVCAIAALRLNLPAASGLAPFAGWPDALRHRVRGRGYQVRGGFQYDGRINAALDEDAIRAAARDMRKNDIRAAAITGVFSLIDSYMEERAAAIVREECPDIAITLSSNVGSLGVVWRENAALINASTTQAMRSLIATMQTDIAELGINAPLLIGQNDGAFGLADFVGNYPILSFDSSFAIYARGAGTSAGVSDGVVIRELGDRAQFGALQNGYAEVTSKDSLIGDVRCQHRRPVVHEAPLQDQHLATERMRRTLEKAKRRPGAQRCLVGEALSDQVDRVLPKNDRVIVANAEASGAVAAALAEVSGQVTRIFSYQSLGRDAALQLARDEARERAEAAGADPSTLAEVSITETPLQYVPGGAVLVTVRSAGHVNFNKMSHARKMRYQAA